MGQVFLNPWDPPHFVKGFIPSHFSWWNFLGFLRTGAWSMPFLVAHDILDIPRAQLQGLLRASLGPMIVDTNEKLGKDINFMTRQTCCWKLIWILHLSNWLLTSCCCYLNCWYPCDRLCLCISLSLWIKEARIHQMIAIILRYVLGFQQNLTHTKYNYIIVELVCLPGFRAHIRTYFVVQPGQPHTSTLGAAGGQKSDDLEWVFHVAGGNDHRIKRVHVSTYNIYIYILCNMDMYIYIYYNIVI